mgnify:CR=1 FL=1|jgi:hypothetical protein|nr:MAG TPA: DIRP protein [Caudoviricetes sp.]
MSVSESVYTDYVKTMKYAEELMAVVRGIYPQLTPTEAVNRVYCDGVITREEWRLIRERYGK